MSNSYQDFYRHSIEDPNSFWGEQAKFIDWHKPFSKVLDYSRPPFTKWFVGGETNLWGFIPWQQVSEETKMAHLGKVSPLALRRMASSIASSYGDDGAIVISVGKEGVRIGIEGLAPQQIQDALCIAIHYNFCFSDNESTSWPCLIFLGFLPNAKAEDFWDYPNHLLQQDA